MYTPVLGKASRRWRRLVWRLASPLQVSPLGSTYSTWVASTIIATLVLRAAVSSSGAADSHRAHVEANGSYAKSKFAEHYDNPLYRLPPNPAGGHRADGLSPWAARAKAFEHH